jgi:hypothetical protein
LLEPFITYAVARSGQCVLASVEFDGESQRRAVEIENVTARGMLAPKVRVANLTVFSTGATAAFPHQFHRVGVVGRTLFFPVFD